MPATPSAPDAVAISEALSAVIDPEIGRPITELGMVKSVDVADDGSVTVTVYLTIAGCPRKTDITDDVTKAASAVPGVTGVEVVLDVMSDEQRQELRANLQGNRDERDIPFNRPGDTTKIIAVASGKGGVGKSSITANLAVALADQGLSVGIVDADILGHSIPRLLGALEPPTMVDDLALPPVAHGVRVASMLTLKNGPVTQAIAFRGPVLHRALQQFLTLFYWGDLDVLLLDLPPGTGDIAMSTAQLLPQAELLVVTTPQPAAAEVSVRAGTLSQYTNQRVLGVVENMSALPCPHCGEPIDLFGVGGGQMVAEALTGDLGYDVPLMARVPFDVRLREGGDHGIPLVAASPESPAAQAIRELASRIAEKPRGLAGMSLGITPASRA